MGLHKRSTSCNQRRVINVTPKNVQQKLWFKALVSSRHVRRKNQPKRDIGPYLDSISFIDGKPLFDHGKFTRFSEKRFIENSLDLINRPDALSADQSADVTGHSDVGDDSSSGSDSKLYLSAQDTMEATNDFEERSNVKYVKVVHLRNNNHTCPLDMEHSQSSDSDSDTHVSFDQILRLSELKLKLENHKIPSDTSVENLSHDMDMDLNKDCVISSSSSTVCDDESATIIKLEGNKSQRFSANGKMSKILAFNIPDRNQIMVILQHPTEVVIKGISWLKVVSGSVTAYGFHMDSSKPAVGMFSLKKFGYINVSTSASELRTLRSSKKNIASELKAYTGIPFTLSKNVLTDLSVILLLQPAKMLKRRVEYALTHIGENCLPSFSKHPDEISAYGLSISLVTPSTKLACNITEEWHHVADMLCDALSMSKREGSAAPRVVVCGGKNSGKSTFLRYLMNAMLNVCSNCCHLEADIGQTEFSPPGCISLTCVDTPIFGPSSTHIKNPEKMCFLGAPAVKIPNDYLSAFTDAFEYYTQHQQKSPLFVNTMGWTKDLGLLLLMDIFHIIQPTHIIQINFEDNRRGQNFHSLTPQFAFGTNGWKFAKSDKELLQYHLIEISSISHTGHTSGSFTPAESRNLAILSYLGRLQPANCLEFLPINSFYPYMLPWSAVAVYICHHTISQKEILFAVNGSWVGLCRVPDPKVLEGDDEMPKILASIHNNECFGFGIIRGIDPMKKSFYIIAPEPLRKLRLVNALVKGSINLPERLLTSQDGELLPYINQEKLSSLVID